ncbi:MAG: thiol peroxidase [Cyclobacteriaceae bacterium]
MAKTALKGNEVNTSGNLPEVGSQAPDFNLVNKDLSPLSLSDLKGSKVILNIYPSVDTGTCAMSTVRFNKEASNLSNTKIVCVSMDLPFAFGRYCEAEGIDNLVTASNFRDKGSFGKSYGVEIVDGPLTGLNARAVVVLDEGGKVTHTELVSEIVNEPDYDKALAAI